ncbi:MAG: Dabb family protein [Phocaeicola sp.]|uniref:Dabb family protein n=1 Tax=Phocaeicola TaxID=909656 RepID=UPI00234F3689|nr:Dabb family protein [Phocaeicola oris]MCE2616667.1 Dabb family protein [Phocaeicola oris]
MVKHIVLFKLKETLSLDEKEVYMKQFKEAIEALPAVIPFIKKIFVGFNVNSDEKWDICLESEFRTLEEVKEYSVHPSHIKAAGILKDVKVDRACVDYDI